MSRRYKRRRNAESDAVLGLAALVTIAVISTYRKLSAQALDLVIAGFLIFAGLGVGVVAYIYFKRQKHEQQKLRALSMVDIQFMDGRAFEKYIAELLKKQAYNHIRLTGYTDYGVDIVAQKENINWAVQVKRYKGLVGVDAIYQAVGGLKMYKCQRAMVVTNSGYTRQARMLAKSNDCVLVDKDLLAEWIIAFQTV